MPCHAPAGGRPDVQRVGKHRADRAPDPRVPARGRDPGRRRRQPRRDRRPGQGGGRASCPRSTCWPGTRSPDWAARTGPASRGGSSGATTHSSRSTRTSRTTRRPCPRCWPLSRRVMTSPSARATSAAGRSPSGPGTDTCSHAAATSTPPPCWAWASPTPPRGTGPTRSRILRSLDLDRIRAEGYGFQIEMTYRSKQHGAAITEVPISFVDRMAGESKMSSVIVVEALALVTWWALGRLVRAARAAVSSAATGMSSADGERPCCSARRRWSGPGRASSVEPVAEDPVASP